MIVWSYNFANFRRNVDLNTLKFVIELHHRHLKFEVTGFGQFYDVNWDFLYQILMVKIQKGYPEMVKGFSIERFMCLSTRLFSTPKKLFAQTLIKTN